MNKSGHLHEPPRYQQKAFRVGDSGLYPIFQYWLSGILAELSYSCPVSEDIRSKEIRYGRYLWMRRPGLVWLNCRRPSIKPLSGP